MDREQAHAALLRLAAGVRQDADAPGALLRRVADAGVEELHAALIEAGAAAAVIEARRPEHP